MCFCLSESNNDLWSDLLRLFIYIIWFTMGFCCDYNFFPWSMLCFPTADLQIWTPVSLSVNLNFNLDNLDKEEIRHWCKLVLLSSINICCDSYGEGKCFLMKRFTLKWEQRWSFFTTKTKMMSFQTQEHYQMWSMGVLVSWWGVWLFQTGTESNALQDNNHINTLSLVSEQITNANMRYKC